MAELRCGVDVQGPMPGPAGGPDGGRHVTDVTNAARTNLMDLASRTWHKPTMRLFGATAAMLPRICSNAETYGCARPAATPAAFPSFVSPCQFWQTFGSIFVSWYCLLAGFRRPVLPSQDLRVRETEGRP